MEEASSYTFCPKDGGRRLIPNNGVYPPNYTASYLGRLALNLAVVETSSRTSLDFWE
jgi:hypothetical protein